MKRCGIWVAIFVLAIGISGCNRQATRSTQAEAPPIAPKDATGSYASVVKPETYSQSIYVESAAPTGTEKPVSAVNNVSIDFLDASGSSVLIRAAGLVTGAWKTPMLVPVDEESEDKTVKKFKFVAVPDSPEKKPERAIYVRRVIQNLPPEVKQVQIVAAQNVASVTIVRPAEAKNLVAQK